MTDLDLTPPTKKAKTAPAKGEPKAEKVAKEPKAPKAPKEPKVVDPNAPVKDRAPRKDYGYAASAFISITEKENKYRGQRLEWYQLLVASNGKTAADYEAAAKAAGKTEPSRGWLRFFVQDGAAVLTKPEAEATPAQAE